MKNIPDKITELRLIFFIIIALHTGIGLLSYLSLYGYQFISHWFIGGILITSGVLVIFTFLPPVRQTGNQIIQNGVIFFYQFAASLLASLEILQKQYQPASLMMYFTHLITIAYLWRDCSKQLSLFLILATALIAIHPLIGGTANAQWASTLAIIGAWNLAVGWIVRGFWAWQISHVERTNQRILQEKQEYAEELHRERLYLKNILDNIDTFITLVDKEGNILHINQPFIKYIAEHNVDARDMVGKSFISLAASEERRQAVASYMSAALQGQEVSAEFHNWILDRYLSLRYCPVKDEHTGQIYGVAIYYRDITHPYRTQQQIKLFSNQLKAILDSMDQNVYLIDREGKIINLNKNAREGKLGFPPITMLEKPLADYLDNPEQKESYYYYFQKTLAGDLTSIDYRIPKTSTWVQIKYMPAYDEEGNIFGVIITIADITRRKHSEEILLYAIQRNKTAREEIKKREIMYRQLLDASPDQIALKDIHGNYLWVNKQFFHFYGNDWQARQQEQTAEDSWDRTVVETKEAVSYQSWERNHSGEEHLLHVIRAPIFSSNGKVEQIAVFATDITKENERIQTLQQLIESYQELSLQERTKAKQLAESQAILKLLAENTTELITLAKADGRMVYVSPSVKRLLGFSPEEMMDRTLTEFFHFDDLQNLQQTSEDAPVEERILQHRLRNRGGEYIWFETIWKYIYDEQKKVSGVQTSSRNISDRIAAKLALQALATRYQTLFKSSYDAVLILKPSPNRRIRFRVIEANAAAEELLGYTVKELQSIDITQLEEELSWKQLRQRVKLFAAQKEFLQQTRIRRKDGSLIWVEITVISFYAEEEEYFQLTIRDISVRKQAEEAIKAKEIAEKALEFKTNFLAKMSHEIRTPMNGLQGMVLMLLSTQLDQHQRKIVESIQSTTKGLLNILNDILDLSKLEAGKLSLHLAPMDLRQCIGQVYDLFSAAALEKKLVLSYLIADKIPTLIISDYERVRQIINNLVSNAIKFTEQGSVTIIAELVEESQQDYLIKVTVRDTGIGISEASLQRLFEKFYQGQEAVRKIGTGLGLAICKELTHLLGGQIGVQSSLGKGSSFWFTFRAQKVSSEIRQVPSLPEEQYQYRAIAPLYVLLVEDVKVNQDVIKWMLEEIGIQVTLASNGLEAYEYARTGKYDLIIMDINMPVMDGITAVAHIKTVLETPPPIVGLSAHALASQVSQFTSQGFNAYLTKPISPEQLYKTLYQFLPQKIERQPVTDAQDDHIITASETEPLMSRATIEHVRKLAGKNTGMWQGLLKSFIADIAQLKEKIAIAHAQALYQEMTKSLHTLKGLCGTIGASRLFSYTIALYQKANEAPHSITAEHLTQLFSLIEQTTEVVQEQYLSDTFASSS